MNEIFKLIAESGRTDLMEEWYKIEKKLEVLEILKPRIHLTHSTLNGKKVVFIEATGFTIEDDKEHRLLKYWLRRK